jgi:hypothetical protein
VPLDGDRQNPAAAVEMRGLVDGHVVTEGVDCSEADIACTRRVAPVPVRSVLLRRTYGRTY